MSEREEVTPKQVPKFGLVKWRREADGRYVPLLVAQAGWVKLTQAELNRHGFGSLTPRCVHILIAAGMVRGTQVSPRKCMFDVASLHEHVEAAAEVDFWTEERVRVYGQARLAVRGRGEE